MKAEKYQLAKALGASKAGVAKIAAAVAKRYGFEPGDSTEDLAISLGGTIRRQLPASDGVDASLVVHGPRKFEISLSLDVGVQRERFSIAHELGHYFLHSKMGEKQIRATRYGSSPVEWEANWFAAELLMPENLFRELASDRDDEALAAHFFVSPAAAKVRRTALGL